MLKVLIREVQKHQQILRFLISGGSAFTATIVALYIFTDIFHIYYLFSTVLAFLIGFCVSFIMQKFWTFRDHSRDQMHLQLVLYLVMQGANLALNTFFMFVFVEYLHIWYLLSQFIIALGLAFGSYFINRRYIFKPQTEHI